MVQAGSVNWETHGLMKLAQLYEQSKVNKKYLFIWDKQGSVATFI